MNKEILSPDSFSVIQAKLFLLIAKRKTVLYLVISVFFNEIVGKKNKYENRKLFGLSIIAGSVSFINFELLNEIE